MCRVYTHFVLFELTVNLCENTGTFTSASRLCSVQSCNIGKYGFSLAFCSIQSIIDRETDRRTHMLCTGSSIDADMLFNL